MKQLTDVDLFDRSLHSIFLWFIYQWIFFYFNMRSRNLTVLLLLLLQLLFPPKTTLASNQWSLQSRLYLDDAYNETHTYNGDSHYTLVGRGFKALISGYNGDQLWIIPPIMLIVTSEYDPGIYVHTNDDGYASRGHYVWTQQAKLIPKVSCWKHWSIFWIWNLNWDHQDSINEVSSTDQFGKLVAFRNGSLLVTAPYNSEPRAEEMGAIYVFNGSLR